jgi:hypothetical protein
MMIMMMDVRHRCKLVDDDLDDDNATWMLWMFLTVLIANLGLVILWTCDQLFMLWTCDLCGQLVILWSLWSTCYIVNLWSVWSTCYIMNLWSQWSTCYIVNCELVVFVNFIVLWIFIEIFPYWYSYRLYFRFRPILMYFSYRFSFGVTVSDKKWKW